MVFYGSIIIIIIFTLFVAMYQYYKIIKQCVNEIAKNDISETTNKTNIIVSQPTIPIPPIDPVKEYDYKKIYDPLEDPTQRVDRYLLGPLEYRRMFNYPTLGYPDNYRWMGLLIDEHATDEKNKVLRLFGRQKYPRSNEYQYYTMINMGHDQIKVHIPKKRELYDHDTVTVDELGKTFEVKLNKDDDMRYVPF